MITTISLETLQNRYTYSRKAEEKNFYCMNCSSLFQWFWHQHKKFCKCSIFDKCFLIIFACFAKFVAKCAAKN
jgi:hypothetical protein